MSSLVFPSSLPGINIKVTREPAFDTKVVETLTGKELRSTWWTYPRYRYSVSFELLRSAAALSEFQKLYGFIMRHLGSWDSFLFTDPDDNAPYASSGAAGGSHYFGIGDGTTTSFQLQRTFVADADLAAAASRKYWPVAGDGYEPVFDLNSTPSIYADFGGGGVLQVLNTNYTLPGAGIVSFSLPPPTGAPGITPSTTGGTLAAGTYFYKISALNASGESIGGTEASVTNTGSTSSNALTWGSVTGATSYRVYRGTTTGGENVFYAPGNVTSYTDTNAASTGGSPLTAPTGTKAPASGTLLLWAGTYYRRVRFDTDRISAERIVTTFWAAKSVPMISVKP